MALNSGQLSIIMINELDKKGINGVSIPNFCQAMSEGVITTFISMNIVSTFDSGTTGFGQGIGNGRTCISGINPQILGARYASNLYKRKIRGVDMESFANAVSTSVISHILDNNLVNTMNAGVAVGMGTGKISGLEPMTMSNACQINMKNKDIHGITVKDFCDAFGLAFCEHIQSMAIITITISGSPTSPFAGSGTGFGKVT